MRVLAGWLFWVGITLLVLSPVVEAWWAIVGMLSMFSAVAIAYIKTDHLD